MILNKDRFQFRISRKETRAERTAAKIGTEINLPFSFALVNFNFSDNVAFTTRTAACFGSYEIFVIGNIPEYSVLKAKSAGHNSYVKYTQFSRPIDLVTYARTHAYDIISAELTDDAKSLYDYKFDFSKRTIIVLGNESLGVPSEILMASKDVVYIPMGGLGFCLNTSQTGTAFANEFARQYYKEA